MELITPQLVVFDLISGLMLGALYALTSFGLTFVYGVLQFVNSAQGQLMMLGAYVTYWLFVLYGLTPFESLFVSLVVGLALGFLIFASIVRRLLGVPPIYTLIAAFGLSIILEESAKLAWGPTYRAFIYDVGSVGFLGFTIPLLKVYGALTSVAIMAFLYVFLYRTESGRIVRSVVQSPEGAALCGIDVRKVYAYSFAMGIGLTVASGALLTFYVSSGINPYMGAPYTDIAFAIAVLGGLGSPEGALVGGLIYGLVETMSFLGFSLLPNISPYSMSRFVSFVLLLLVLLVRPRGLFGR
ncbi:MAG: branched-chain amino acid ABC transporter permease [Desulfurococcaceae archaeon]